MKNTVDTPVNGKVLNVFDLRNLQKVIKGDVYCYIAFYQNKEVSKNSI